MPSTQSISKSLVICPFCGSVNNKPGKPCARCTLEDTAAIRSATKSRIGPWYVLQARNPAAPGMKLETLKSLIRRGYVTPQSVLRGPTTHQLWQWAGSVRGISREFGICYSCGSRLEPEATQCPHCNRSQLPAIDPEAPLEARPLTPQDKPKEIEQKVPPPVDSADSSDVLSPRDLAMIFQLGYDPPERSPSKSPTIKRSHLKVAPALAATVAVLVMIWILWPTKPAARLTKIEPASRPSLVQSVHPMVQLIAVPVREERASPRLARTVEKPLENSPTIQAQKLWNQALDAEANRDFAGALKLYQRLADYPPAVQPPSLKTRLALVRQELLVGTN